MEIVPFNYEDHRVRTVDLNGEPWFVAADVCTVLEIANVGNALARLDGDDIRSTDVVDSLGRRQQSKIVNESGLYDLILDSRKPEAKSFRRWITSVVLPQIRQTGVYMSKPTSQLDILRSALDEIETAQRTALEAKEEVAALSTRVDALEGEDGWWTASGYLRSKSIIWNPDKINALGRIAARIGRSKGLKNGKYHHPRWGWVNTWPAEVWGEAVVYMAGAA